MISPGDPNPFPTAKVLRTAGANRAIDAQWVLVGWRERGKCVLLASEAVDHATLTFAKIPQYYFQFLDAADLRTLGIGMARHLTADILSYVLIEADTFAECLAALLFGHQWKPDTHLALGTAGMGRPAGPHAATEPVTTCDEIGGYGHEDVFCDLPRGHGGDEHSFTVTWPIFPATPAIEGTPT